MGIDGVGVGGALEVDEVHFLLQRVNGGLQLATRGGVTGRRGDVLRARCLGKGRKQIEK